MSISGSIIRYQLACPSQDQGNESGIKVIVKCYRMIDDGITFTKETLMSKHNHPVVDIVYKVERGQPRVSHDMQTILYTFDYKIENILPGVYSVFAYEDCEEARGSLVYPQKQAFGWSTNEIAGRWTQYTIQNVNTNIQQADIVLRKPHSFFSMNYPLTIENARFRTINQIPVLQLNASTPEDRGYSHGYLLAPHILDWFCFYLLEENFQSIAQYHEFYAFVDPTSNFFHYPTAYLREIQGILNGMQARTDCDLFLYEFNRPFDLIDLLAMNSYIERRTIRPDLRASSSSEEPNCSQIVVWDSLTADKRIIAGRNMDGECDVRRVTVSTTFLLAVNSIDQPREYRYISLTWPGIIGTLSGVNETGLYCMENAGPSQIGGQIKGLTPVSYVATHVLRTLDARLATKSVLQTQFEEFTCDPTSNKDLDVWPTKQAKSELKGPVCGPGSVFVLITRPNDEADAFVLEGDRYGGCIRTSMQAPPYIPHCIMATNHFLLYGSTFSSSNDHSKFGSTISFSSRHRYESMRHRLETYDRSRKDRIHLNVEDVRSLLQTACEGRTEHALEVEIESNGNITIHIHLAALEFGLWYAPYELAQTIQFEQLFV